MTLSGTDVRIFVDPQTGYGSQLLQFGFRPTETFIIPLMKAVLRSGDVFADIGAHWGIYALVACRLVGEHGKVLAVEPWKANYQKILENQDLNNFRNLIAVNKAVGEKAGQGILVIRGSGDNLNFLLSEKNANPLIKFFLKVQKCEVSDLPSILKECSLDRVRMMKIDIEGGECLVLKNLAGHMKRMESILIELHPDNPEFPEHVQLIYNCLSENRDLYSLDVGEFPQRIHTLDHFRIKLPRYYFFTISQDSDIDMKRLKL